jgi:xylono-1,5-lactonase
MVIRRLDAEHAARVGAILGEGPIWVERDQALWFVDIKQHRVYKFDPATGAIQSWEAPDKIGWLLPSADGDFLAGLAKGLHRFNPATGKFDLYREVEAHLPDNRLNDAAIDSEGRAWFGTMDNKETNASGRLYCLNRGTVTDSGLAPICITNGPAISPDGHTLYAVDTLGRSIDAFSLGSDGALSGRRRFLTLGDDDKGFPDGAICDAAGGVWLGLFFGSAARRYTADGKQTHEVRFPVSNVTKIALGGPDGRTAYATTARQGLDASTLVNEPLAGDIFTFRVDVPGVPAPALALD